MNDQDIIEESDNQSSARRYRRDYERDVDEFVYNLTVAVIVMTIIGILFGLWMYKQPKREVAAYLEGRYSSEVAEERTNSMSRSECIEFRDNVVGGKEMR